MLQKSNMYKTVEVFFLSPTKKHYLMDISRNIGLAHTSVKKNLNELARLGIIKESIEVRGGRKFPFYQSDMENTLFIRYKKIYNLVSVIESGLIEFIEEKMMPRSIVLFGSYQRGEDIEGSDIDIFVECEGEELNLGRFEKRLGRKIELHFKKNFTHYSKELKNNITNGVVLMGFLEGYR